MPAWIQSARELGYGVHDPNGNQTEGLHNENIYGFAIYTKLSVNRRLYSARNVYDKRQTGERIQRFY